jgi:hypothetical protein
METQKEQIKKAKRAYLMTLNDPRDGMSALRFAVYLDAGSGLDILWPSDSHEGKKSKELLHRQVYTEKRKYPAFHFSLSGCGYSKSNEIRSELEKINPSIKVYTLGGSMPSNA